MVTERRDAGLTVIHVDDHARTPELPANAIERAADSVSVLVASDFDGALDLLDSHPVHCVVSAFELPDGSTLPSFLADLRERAPGVPVVCYASVDPARVEPHLEAGSVSLVQRPADAPGPHGVLANRIESLVDHSGSEDVAGLTPAIFEDVLDGLGMALCLVADGDIVHATGTFDDWFDLGGSQPSVRGILGHVIDGAGELRAFIDDPAGETDGIVFRLPNGTQKRFRARAVSGDDGVAAIYHAGPSSGERQTREETMLQSLLENVPVAMYFKDEQGRHQKVSDALVGMSAESFVQNAEGKRFHDAEDVIGNTDYDLYKPNHAVPAAEDDQKVLETGEPVAGREEFTVSANDEEVWLMTMKAPWYDGDGEIQGVAGVTIDITDHKRDIGAMENLDSRLAKFEETVVRALTERVTEARQTLGHALDTNDDRQLRELAEQLDEMDEILDHGLELARFSQIPATVERTDLRALATDVWASLPTRDAELDLELSTPVLADDPRLELLFERVFEIVLDYGGDGVTVEVGELSEGFFVEHDATSASGPRDSFLDVTFAESDVAENLALTTIVGIANAHGWDANISTDTSRFEFTGVEWV